MYVSLGVSWMPVCDPPCPPDQECSLEPIPCPPGQRFCPMEMRPQCVPKRPPPPGPERLPDWSRCQVECQKKCGPIIYCVREPCPQPRPGAPECQAKCMEECMRGLTPSPPGGGEGGGPLDLGIDTKTIVAVGALAIGAVLLISVLKG